MGVVQCGHDTFERGVTFRLDVDRLAGQMRVAVSGTARFVFAFAYVGGRVGISTGLRTDLNTQSNTVRTSEVPTHSKPLYGL